MTDIVSIGFQVDTSQIATGTRHMEKLGKTAESTEKNTNNLATSLGGLGRRMGQAGIQIQQFYGQVQMGTNPMVAASQQLTDFGFVLGAPLLGAIGGIAASLALTLAPNLFETEDAAKKLTDTIESLDKVVTQTAGGTYTLSAEIARLAKVSETAANAQIALSITEATQAINLARDAADEAIESFDDLFNGFDVVSTPETLNKLNEAMQRTGLSAAELLNSSNLYATGLTQIKSFSDSLSDSLGTTTADSIKLIQAVSDFRQGGSVSQLAETFSTISLSTNGATKEFQALAVNLNNLSLTTEKSEAVLDLLKSTLGDLAGILEHSDSVVNDIINSYKMKTDALSADETQMAKNIALQTIGTDATQEEKDAVLQAVDAYYKKLNAIKSEEDAQRKANKEREEAVKLAQKEAELAFRDLISGTDTVDLFALNQAKAYDKWIESISTTSTRMAELRAEIEKTQAAVESGDLSSSVAAEYIADLNAQIEALSVNPFESMTQGAQDALQAMSGMFESGSKDAKKLAIAMQALNLVQAVGAVLNQGSGDPYTAFGRMAAMAAMVASLGVSIGGLSGGMADESAKNQENQNLNSWGEQATSIADATEETASATSKLVGINTDMLKALQNLTVALASASNIVAKNINIPTANASTYSFGSFDLINGVIPGLVEGIDLFSNFTQLVPNIVSSFDIVGNALGSWLGGKSSVTDEGVKIIGGALSDLMDDVTVQAFQSIKYKKWRFGSTKRKTVFSDLGDEVSNQFSLVYASIADSVATGAEILGFSQDEIESAINAFRVGTQSLSLKGLSSEKQAEVIENYFSSVFNGVAKSVVPFLTDFQQVGEELGATLSRLATEVSVAEYLIDNFGVTFVDKMADQEAFVKAADNLAMLSGGAEELASRVSSFTDAFASNSLKFDIYQSSLTKSLSDVGLELPKTAEGMFDLMSSLDASTEAGQQQIATLLELTDAASQYYDLVQKKEDERLSLQSQFAQVIGDTDYLRQMELESLDESNRALQEKIWNYQDEQDALEKLNAIQDEQDSLLSRLANTLGDTTYAREKELEGIDESNRGLLEYIYSIEDANNAFDEAKNFLDDALSSLSKSVDAQKESVKSTYDEMIQSIESKSDAAKEKVSTIEDLISSLSSAFDTVSDSISGVTLNSRRNAQAILSTQLAISKASGNAPDASIIEGALKTISQPSENLYSDFVSFARDQAIAANTINDLLGVTDDQLTDAQKQINILDSQLEIAEEWYNEEIDKLDKLYSGYEKQYNALIGVDDSVLSVRDATLELKQSMDDYVKAQTAQQATINQSQEGGSVYKAISDMNKELASMQEAQLDLLSSIESNIKRMRLIDEGLTVA